MTKSSIHIPNHNFNALSVVFVLVTLLSIGFNASDIVAPMFAQDWCEYSMDTVSDIPQENNDSEGEIEIEIDDKTPLLVLHQTGPTILQLEFNLQLLKFSDVTISCLTPPPEHV